MSLARGLLGCVGGAMGVFVSGALAAPPVLDHLPANAMVVIAMPNPTQLQKNIQALATAVELPMPVPQVQDLFTQGGFSKGLDAAKSMALVVMAPPKGEKKDGDVQGGMADMAGGGEKNVIVILPTTAYADLVGNFDIKPSGGVDSGKMQGEDAYFKDLGGGYAAMSPTRELITNFKPADGAALRALLGKTGEKIADSSDVFLIVNMDVARPLGPDALKKITEGIASNPAMGALGKVGENLMLRWAGETMMRDTRSIVVGLRPDAMGVAVDMSVAFNNGSYMAKAMTGKGGADQLLTRLPNQPYLFTYAVDLANPGMRTICEDAAKQAEGGKDPALPGIFQQFKNADGVAMSVGASPAGVMGGLMVNTISYIKTSKPDEVIAAIKEGLTKANGTEKNGMSITTTYEPASADAAGMKVDTWQEKMSPSANGDGGQMAMVLPMIYGPAGGPGGYIAKVDGGLYQTFSKNTALLEKAVGTGKGEEALSKDKATAQVGERLPRDRILEVFIGVKSILETVQPLLAMAGMPMDFEVPATLPPVGMGIGPEEGVARIGLYVPAPVIKTVAKMVAGMQGGGMLPGGGPKGGPGKRPGAGQPRF